MMDQMNQSNLTLLKGQVSKELQLNDSELQEPATIDQLRVRLHEIIRYLLDHDFNRLINTLYRIDVSENKVREILSGSNANLPLQIADLIIERQKQKIEFMKHYRSKS